MPIINKQTKQRIFQASQRPCIVRDYGLDNLCFVEYVQVGECCREKSSLEDWRLGLLAERCCGLFFRPGKVERKRFSVSERSARLKRKAGGSTPFLQWSQPGLIATAVPMMHVIHTLFLNQLVIPQSHLSPFDKSRQLAPLNTTTLLTNL